MLLLSHQQRCCSHSFKLSISPAPAGGRGLAAGLPGSIRGCGPRKPKSVIRRAFPFDVAPWRESRDSTARGKNKGICSFKFLRGFVHFWSHKMNKSPCSSRGLRQGAAVAGFTPWCYIERKRSSCHDLPGPGASGSAQAVTRHRPNPTWQSHGWGRARPSMPALAEAAGDNSTHRAPWEAGSSSESTVPRSADVCQPVNYLNRECCASRNRNKYSRSGQLRRAHWRI
jgi:hypothetical protein